MSGKEIVVVEVAKGLRMLKAGDLWVSRGMVEQLDVFALGGVEPIGRVFREIRDVERKDPFWSWDEWMEPSHVIGLTEEGDLALSRFWPGDEHKTPFLNQEQYKAEAAPFLVLADRA